MYALPLVLISFAVERYKIRLEKEEKKGKRELVFVPWHMLPARFYFRNVEGNPIDDAIVEGVRVLCLYR